MKKPILLMLLLWCSLVCFYACSSTPSVDESTTSGEFMLKNDLVEVSVNADGSLVSLKNLSTGHNYATGGYLWRMYYDTHGERESSTLGNGEVAKNGKKVKLGQYDVAVLLFEKE